MNIDNKIRADLFRNRIEDKNQLMGAGAIYVGTGIPKYISSTGAITGAPLTGTIGPFYETVGVTPTSGGQVPVSVMGTGSAEATGTVTGLAFKSVNDAMKGEDGSILLAANGMNVRSSNGITFLNEDAVNTDISITNKMRDISVNAAQNVSIEGKTKTKISNISLDTNLKGPVTGSLYTAPSGSASLDVNGVTGIYSGNKAEENLAPIIYNIGQRLDGLGTIATKNSGEIKPSFNIKAISKWKDVEAVSSTLYTIDLTDNLEDFDFLFFKVNKTNLALSGDVDSDTTAFIPVSVFLDVRNNKTLWVNGLQIFDNSSNRKQITLYNKSDYTKSIGIWGINMPSVSVNFQ